VTRVNEHHVDTARLEDLIERDPVDAGGFHRHAGHTARRQPIGPAMEICGEGLEGAHGSRVPVGGYGDIVRVGTAIDARGIGVDAL
jgi:hypothetical protein